MKVTAFKIPKRERGFLFLSIGAATLGFFILLVCLQFISDLKTKVYGEQDFSDRQFMTINKKVGSPLIQESDLEKLLELPNVEDATPIYGSNFVTLLGSEKMGLYIQLPLEAIDKDWLDLRPPEFSWKAGDSLVPVIVPEELYSLYNFVLAPQMGFPQFDRDKLKEYAFGVELKGKGKTEAYRASIVGFSHRLKSVLVPENFLQVKNDSLGNKAKDNNISRILLDVKNPESLDFIAFMDANDFEYNDDQVRGAKLASILNPSIRVLLLIALLIILLALSTFLLTLLLIFSRSKSRLAVLVEQGYRPGQILQSFDKILFKSALAIFFGSLILACILLTIISGQLESVEWPQRWLPELGVLGIALLSLLAFVGLGRLILNKQVKALF